MLKPSFGFFDEREVFVASPTKVYFVVFGEPHGADAEACAQKEEEDEAVERHVC